MAKQKVLFYITGIWILLFSGIGAVWAAKDPETDRGLVVHLFYSSACSSCHEALVVVAKARSLCPRLEVRYHNLIHPGKARLKQAFCAYYRVPPDHALEIPLIFLGDRYLRKPEITTVHI